MVELSGVSCINNWFSDISEKNYIFTIPQYQRSYAWDICNVEILINDLLTSDSYYFLGLFLLEKERGSKYALIDGQQRFTTIYLLLHAIAKRSDSSKFRIGKVSLDDFLYYKNEPRLFLQKGINQNFFIDLINKSDNCSSIDELKNSLSPKNSSERNLYAVYFYLLNQISEFESKDINKLLRTLASSKILIHIENSTSVAMKVFELMNDRGKKLTVLEAIKCYSMNLIYELTKREKKLQDIQISRLKDHFSSIYDSISKISIYKKNFDGDEILRYFVIAFSAWSDKKDYGNSKELFKRLLQEQKNDVSGILELISKLVSCYEVISLLFEKVYDSEDQSKWLKNIFLLDKMATFYPLILAITHRFPQDWKFLDRVANYLEYFIFRSYAMMKLRSDAGESRFSSLARDIIQKEAEFTRERIVVELINIITTYCDGNSQKQKEFEQALEDPLFYKNHSTSDIRYLVVKFNNELVNQMKRLSQVSEQETKSSPRYPYISELTRIISCKKGSEQEYLSNFKEIITGDKSTIEHIIPQTEPYSKYYQTVTKNSKVWAGKHYISKYFEKNYLHCIGNLVYSRRSANSGKNNNFPEEKEWDVWLSQQLIADMIKRTRRKVIFKYKDKKGESKTVTIKFGIDEIIKRSRQISFFAKKYWANYSFENFMRSDGSINNELRSKFESREPLI